MKKTLIITRGDLEVSLGFEIVVLPAYQVARGGELVSQEVADPLEDYASAKGTAPWQYEKLREVLLRDFPELKGTFPSAFERWQESLWSLWHRGLYKFL